MSTARNTQPGTEENKKAEAASELPSARAKKSPTAFRTISEVADELNVQQHVLRFWETKFTQVKPLKRGGGRRYYRPEDVALLRKIHHLLYSEGYTIKGVQKLLKGQGKQQIIADDFEQPAANESVPAAPVAAEKPKTVVEQRMSDKQRVILQAMLGDLKELRDMLKGEDK